MRVVADTNVLVSAIVFGGPPGRVVEMAAAHQLQLILSPALVEELRQVLRRKIGFSDAAVYQSETLLRRAGVVVEPSIEIAVVVGDPTDNRVLEAAIAGDADVIVSGDCHLLDLKTFDTVPIMTPRELLRMLAERG